VNATEYVEELKTLIRSSYGVIAIETADEERLQSLVLLLADHLNQPLFDWGASTGLRRAGEAAPMYQTQQPARALAHVRSSALEAIYHFRELGDALSNPEVADLTKELANRFSGNPGVLIVSGVHVELAPVLRAHVARFRLPAPRLEDYRQLLASLVRDLRSRMKIHVEISAADLSRVLVNLQGLTMLEARKVLTKALVVDQALTSEDVRRVIEAKREIIRSDGLLEYLPVEETFTEIASLAGLKRWLVARKKAIENPARAREYGLEFPKGMLLLGVPGTGKSLCAKAVAMEWGLPLLKMDPASLYNKYVGQTEENFRRAMETAERMAPVVLWIDEIEKAFAGSGEQDSGTSTRVLGTFLTWLQERDGDVFVVATANDVSKLPAELLRKGRFDELFFVDLPGPEARSEIFRIHFEKRGRSAEHFDLDLLGQSTHGFSGAEIEQAIVAALHTAFARDTMLTAAILLEELSRTRPLSTTMPERVAHIRQWAQGRTVPAN